MITERWFYRSFAVFAFFEGKSGFAELRNHDVFRKIAELNGWIFGVLFGNIIKFFAAVQLFNNFFGSGFIFNQNVFGFSFFFALIIFNVFIIIKIFNGGFGYLLRNGIFKVNFTS